MRICSNKNRTHVHNMNLNHESYLFQRIWEWFRAWSFNVRLNFGLAKGFYSRSSKGGRPPSNISLKNVHQFDKSPNTMGLHAHKTTSRPLVVLICLCCRWVRTRGAILTACGGRMASSDWPIVKAAYSFRSWPPFKCDGRAAAGWGPDCLYKGTYNIFAQSSLQKKWRNITQERFLYHLGQFLCFGHGKSENVADLSSRELPHTQGNKVAALDLLAQISRLLYEEIFMALQCGYIIFMNT